MEDFTKESKNGMTISQEDLDKIKELTDNKDKISKRLKKILEWKKNRAKNMGI